MQARYVPLWCKSNYSFLEGASHPEELVAESARLGLPAVGLTDRDGVYGIVRAHTEAKRLGIKLLVGSEITLEAEGRPRGPSTALPGAADADFFASGSLLLLAQSIGGYRNLCGLISAGRLRHEKGTSSVRVGEVCDRAEGLLAILIGGGRGAGGPGTTEPIERLAAAFPGRLYIGLSRHRRAEELDEERRQRSRSQRFGLPLVALPEVLYHHPSRKSVQDVLTCIRNLTTLDAAGTLIKQNSEHALKAPEEMAALYAGEPELLERTLRIAESCTFSLSELEYRYPEERVPEGYTTSGWLRRLTFEGAEKRYRGPVPGDVRRQLERELALIDELGYCGYFLTMWEIVEYCRAKGIICQGRGSAANSAVCYCLAITAIDPVRMDLLFERFLSRERAEPPDIDLDIEHDRREEVIQHMYEKYGRDRAAMVANVIRYRPKSAVRDVGKVLGISSVALDRCAKLLARWEPEIETALAEAGLDPSSRVNRLLLEISRSILDFPRHLSIHPGGFLLGSEPIAHLVPVENATMPDRTVIQWDKYDVEAMNLFKVDLLGLGALTHLDYCFRLLASHYRVDLALATIPPKDDRVFKMIWKADTVGVFQIESRAQMAMLPRLKPETFYDLVIEISIIRPGPITGGMVHPYLRRRAGEEEVHYPHPKLEPVLKKTLGVPLFQEQVMKLAVIAANYTPGEADQLRRDMAAWRRSGAIEKHRDRLISRMVANGIDQHFAEAVFDQIRGFGEYGFPESHAASFATIAWATAWMKYHYPDVFACALLNAWPMGFYLPSTIVEDAKHHGVEVLPIDIRESEWECTLEAAPGKGAASTSGRAGGPDTQHPYAIRMGLRFVKGMGKGDFERVARARRAGATSLEELVHAASVPRDLLVTLAESGALRGFGIYRRNALWKVLGAASAEAERAGGSDLGVIGTQREEAVSFDRLDPFEVIRWDYATSAHSTYGHPVEPYREQLREQGLPDAARLHELQNGVESSYVGLVICRQMPDNAAGVLFVTMEDETGFVNLIVWPKVFDRFRAVLLTSSFLGVSGRIQSGDGTVHIVAQSFWMPQLASRPAAVPSRDFH